MAQAAAHHHDDHHHDHTEHETSLKMLGFWIFLITDCILFGTLFATFAVLRTHTDGGPIGKELFEIPVFVAETFILLTSSFTSGLAVLAMNKGNKNALIGWLVITALLGLAFVGLEVEEFIALANEGATISRSAFLSAFFTLVGTHGCHVTLGLFWMVGLIFQIMRRGITGVTKRKIMIISLYWHFLDAVWIFLFTVVYLMGVM